MRRPSPDLATRALVAGVAFVALLSLTGCASAPQPRASAPPSRAPGSVSGASGSADRPVPTTPANPPSAITPLAITPSVTTPSVTTPSISTPSAAGSRSVLEPAAAAPFLVGPPLLTAPSGPAPESQPPCRPAGVRATAKLQSLPDGVAGVLHLTGDHCSLHIQHGPTALLDVAGQRLDVRLEAGQPSVNPPSNIRPDLALTYGDALWGFTWTGSWCGSKAVAVVVPMTDGPADPSAAGPYGDLAVALTGPQPRCSGASTSVLRPGISGNPASDGSVADAVLPVPPQWAGLRASLELSANSPAGHLPASTFGLSNGTDAPITLSPCPDYALALSFPSGDQGGADPLPCKGSDVVPAHGELRFAIPAQDYDQGSPRRLPAGSRVTEQAAIAGVATATATTVAR